MLIEKYIIPRYIHIKSFSCMQYNNNCILKNGVLIIHTYSIITKIVLSVIVYQLLQLTYKYHTLKYKYLVYIQMTSKLQKNSRQYGYMFNQLISCNLSHPPSVNSLFINCETLIDAISFLEHLPPTCILSCSLVYVSRK